MDNDDDDTNLPRHLTSSLLAALSDRIRSIDALQALVQPVLRCFGLVVHVDDTQDNKDAWTALTQQQKEYILRVSLLAEIQRILLARVAVDWLHHLRHTGPDSENTILRPLFCPPLPPPSPSSPPYAQAVALSAYPVLLETACSDSESRRTSSSSKARRAGLISAERSTTTNTAMDDPQPHPIARSTALAYLADLTNSYGLDTLFRHFFPPAQTPQALQKGRMPQSQSQSRALLDWQAFVALYLSIPARVANIPLDSRKTIPPGLEWRAFLLTASRQAETLLSEPVVEVQRENHTQALAYLLQKLARSGFVAHAPGQLSFWPAIWRPLRRSLLPSPSCKRKHARSSWPEAIGLLPSLDMSSVSTAFFSQLQALRLGHGTAADGEAPTPSQCIKQAALLALRVFGSLTLDMHADADANDRWTLVVHKCLLQRQGWDQGIARVLVAWAALSPPAGALKDNAGTGKTATALGRLLEEVSSVWTDKAVITRGGNAFHAFLSAVLVGTLAALPPMHPSVLALSRSPAFLAAISAHLSSLSAPIRLSGMYVAELVSERSTDPDPTSGIKPLSFGEVWADEEGRSTRDGGMDAVQRLRALAEMEKGDWAVEDWVEPDDGEGVVVEEEQAQVNLAHTTAKAYARAAMDGRKEAAAPKAALTALSKIQVIASDYDDYDRSDSDTGADVDEDDLQPFALPPLPPAADLKDLEDPTIQTSLDAKNRIHPPVYLPDLLAYLRSGNDSTDKQAAEKVAVGLREAEGLIRRKGSWGSELLDNAVELSFVLSGLQDNFSLPGFEEQRRDAMTALMVSCPARAATAVIEQFFSQQYSVSQRFAMLSALAMGARELAGLPSLTAPPARINDDQNPAGSPRAIDTDFPTQRLPPKLHKYFMQVQGDGSEEGSPAGGPSTPQLDAITEDITNLALSSTRREAEQAVPGAKREKLLTVRSTTTKRSKIVEQAGSSMNGVGNGAHSRPAAPKFADLAVETFIMPLINRFWLYLRDVSTSPQLATVGPYAGGRAGAAPLLDPLLLSKYLSTLCVLLDAARNSPHFLAVLAPETLELVLALRSGAEVDGTPARRGGVNADAVQTALLQLSLVVLETSTSIDSGRTLARDFPKITWRVKDWAEEVWRGKESGGGEVDAGGRAAAGVLLRLDEVVSRTIGYH